MPGVSVRAVCATDPPRPRYSNPTMSDTSEPSRRTETRRLGACTHADAEERRTAPASVVLVAPAFNEADALAAFCQAVRDALDGLPWKLLIVDDGSTDGTQQVLADLARDDSRIAGLILSRNFGHQYALAAGLSRADGEVVVTLDADGQHPPAVLPHLLDRWRDGANVVHTRRRDVLKLPLFKRLTSRAYYRLFSFLCGVRLEPGMADFRLLDRRVVRQLNAMTSGQVFLRGMIAWMGYRSAVVDYDVAPRLAGRSKYTFRRMFSIAGTGIFSFSTVPLRLSILLGLVTAGLAFAELIYVLVAWIFFDTVRGWASTLVVVTFLFGLLFLILGLQGEYLLRIFQRSQQRPSFLIERTVGESAPDESAPPQEGQPTP